MFLQCEHVCVCVSLYLLCGDYKNNHSIAKVRTFCWSSKLQRLFEGYDMAIRLGLQLG